MVSTCIQDNRILNLSSTNISQVKNVLDDSNNQFKYPALNVSNNFATIDYDAHINTKINYAINHVFRAMTLQELNTLHTVC